MKRLVTRVLWIGLGVAIGAGASLATKRLHAEQPAPPQPQTAFMVGGQVASTPWVAVHEAGGREAMGFAAQAAPFKPGVPTRVGDDRIVRAVDGRTITGFAYYGWTTGSRVRVVVLARVPEHQAKTTSFPGESDYPGTRYEQVAEFTLALGESRRVDELKAFGGEPTTVQVVTRR